MHRIVDEYADGTTALCRGDVSAAESPYADNGRPGGRTQKLTAAKLPLQKSDHASSLEANEWLAVILPQIPNIADGRVFA